jgi:fructokinase
MRQVVCFGEALIDFLHTGAQIQHDLSLNTYTQFPGGAPANAAVAVAKLGGTAAFSGQVGDDPFGQFIVQALNLYHVDTSFVTVHPTAKTALAFVFLDDTGERRFSFHRHQTADVVLNESQVKPEWF